MADLPETFNGEPTRYHVFDGFRRANIAVKTLYIAAPFAAGIGIVVPAVLELMAYDTSKVARHAVNSIRERSAAAYYPPVPDPALAMESSAAPLLTQINDGNTTFQDAVPQKRLEEAHAAPHM